MRLHIQSYILFLCTLVLLGCHKNGGDIPAPGSAINVNTIYVDTFSVEMSTVLIDSLVTSNAARMLAGAYLDPALGKISTSTYFQLSLNGIDTDGDGHEDVIASGAVDPVYDSLVLVLPYSYSYGDTTQAQTFHIHRVNETMNYVRNTGYLYNSSSFAYDNTPLATVTFKPVQNMNTSMRVHIDDNLGQEIFNLAKQESYKLGNNADFHEYFRGLVIRPDQAVSNFITGFNVAPTLCFYYHEDADPTTVKSYTFRNTSSDIHFNQIVNNRAGTDLSSLINDYQAIPSAQSSNRSFFLSGISLMTKFTIPYLHELRSIYPNFIIVKAYLVLNPEYNTYSAKYPLPQSLMLYLADQYNLPTGTIEYDHYTSTQYVSPVIDYEAQQNTYYKFELTKFIQDEIQYTTDTRRCLLLSSGINSANKAEKIIIPENNPQNKGAKLILYLTVKQ